MIANIVKRTFEARFTNDKAERERLNKNPGTSEYMTSYKWLLLIWNDKGKSISQRSYKTRKEAEEVYKIMKKGGW